MRAAAGLSRSKVVFLRDLAERVATGSIVLEDLDALPDDQVGEMLLEVKGIGQWTVDMFLIFHLGRPDVLPVGDLGIRRAAMLRYRLRKLPEPKRLTTLARPWRPWRSVASWYLWASLRAIPA
jgi:DNA-3-methyladenine glycosylase II